MTWIICSALTLVNPRNAIRDRFFSMNENLA